MRVLHLIRRVTLRDKFRNTYIRSKLGVKRILRCVEETQLRWYGHVRRMLDRRLPQRLLHWRQNSTRPPGRPRKRWIGNIKGLRRVEPVHWTMSRVPAFTRTGVAGHTSQTGLRPTCKVVQDTRYTAKISMCRLCQTWE